MNVGRAKQIVESPSEIDVRHQGEAIWIQDLNEAEETARIYPLDNPENEKVVAVRELEEK